jgi:hypothetical protein
MHACQVAAVDRIYAGMNEMIERRKERKSPGEGRDTGKES